MITPGNVSIGDATERTVRTQLEAWKPHHGGAGGVAGMAEWMVHSKAHASTDWAESAKQWLSPTSQVLAPNATAEFAFQFSVAEHIRAKDAAIDAAGLARVLGVPGYIIGTDFETAMLLVHPPHNTTLLRASSDEVCLVVGRPVPAASGGGWVVVPLIAVADGRPRLTLSFSDGSTMVIPYRTTEPFDARVDRYGKFQSEVAFFNQTDPFRRGPSIMPWDRELGAHVLNDPRLFIVGLSDEGGAGANVGFASKLRFRPTQSELAKVDAYIEHTLWGLEEDGAGVPVSLQDHSSYGVKSSMFWAPLPGITVRCISRRLLVRPAKCRQCLLAWLANPDRSANYVRFERNWYARIRLPSRRLYRLDLGSGPR